MGWGHVLEVALNDAVFVEPALSEEENSMSVSNSNLSAEAESFVPGSRNSSSTQDLAADPGGGGRGELPQYVTSCYPFVQDDGIQALAQG